MARTGPPRALAGRVTSTAVGVTGVAVTVDVVAIAAAPEQDDARDRRHPLAADAHDAARRGARDAQAPGAARDGVDDGARERLPTPRRRAPGPAWVRRRRCPPAPGRAPRPGPGPRARARRWRPTAGQRPGVGGSTQAGPRSVGRLRGELTGSRGRSALPGIRPGFAPGTHARVPVGPPLRRDRVGDRGRLGVSTEVGAGSYTRRRMSGTELRSGRRNPSRLPYHAPSRRADVPPCGFLTPS